MKAEQIPTGIAGTVPLLKNMAVLCLVPTIIVITYKTTIYFLQKLGSDDLHLLTNYFSKTGAFDYRIVLAAGLFLLMNIINFMIDRRQKIFARPVFGLFVPLFLAAGASSSSLLFAAVAAMIPPLFILGKVIERRPLLNYTSPEKRAGAPGWEPAGFIFSGLILGAIFIFNVSISPIPEIAALYLIVCLIAFLAVKRQLRTLIRMEFIFLALIILQLVLVASIAGAAGAWDSRSMPGQLLILLILLHFYLFYSDHRRVTRFNTTMLLLTLAGLCAVELALAPFHFGERTPIGQTVSAEAPIATDQTYNYIFTVTEERFRGKKPSSPKPPKTYRIIAQGSSSTEGAGVKRDEDVWPAVLETRLNALGRPFHFEVFNAGRGGTTSFFLFLNFKNVLLKYRPDMLILYLGHNDANYVRSPFTEHQLFEMAMQKDFKPTLILKEKDQRPTAGNPSPNPYTPWLLKSQLFLSRFSLYRLLVKQELDFRQVLFNYGTAGSPVANFVPFVPLEDYRENLESFVGLCRQEAISLILVGEAAQATLDPQKAVMASVASAYHLPYIDANDGFYRCTDNIPEMFLDNVHLTIKGNICVAQTIIDLLTTQNLLPEKMR